MQHLTTSEPPSDRRRFWLRLSAAALIVIVVAVGTTMWLRTDTRDRPHSYEEHVRRSPLKGAAMKPTDRARRSLVVLALALLVLGQAAMPTSTQLAEVRKYIASGWTTLTRISSAAHSSAATRASCVRAALEAE